MQRDLVERARTGDLDAFAQLVRASAPRLRGVANLILRDIDRAEDALQDALLLAWRDLRALRDPDAWDAWLRRLTVRACYKAAGNGWALDIGHGATPLIEDNDISAAGIYVYEGIADGTNAVIRRNRVHDAEPSMEIKGIQIEPGATATIEQNEIFGNADGVRITSTAATVRDNDIHDNGTGIALTGSSPDLEGNTIGSNRVGLEVSGSSANPVLSGNVICDNETNVALVGGAELADTTGNEICEDAPAE